MKLPELDVALRLTDSVGLPTNVWFNDQPVHSLKNSEQEFQRFISSNLDTVPDQSRLLLIGAGALFDRLLPTAQRLKLTIYEPVIQLRELYASRTELPLLDISSLNTLPKFDTMIVLPAYRRLFKDIISRIEALFLTQNPVISQVDQTTTDRFLRQWIRNYRIHLSSETICYFNEISPSPTTILFCGTGPTLFQDLEKYKSYFEPNKQPPFLICADSIAAALLYSGWPVDLITTIDSGFGTSFHLSLLVNLCKTLDVKPPPVLTWLAGTLFIQKSNLETYYVNTLFPPDQILTASSKLPPPFTNQYRNLIGYAVALSQLNHCQLLLAGVGFTSQRQRFYCRGSGYDFYYLLNQNRLQPLETQSFRLESKQKNSNIIAKSQLKTLQKTHSQQSKPELTDTKQPIRYTIQFQTESTTTLRKILHNSNIGHLLKAEFGEKWADYSRRYLNFLD
ncbi:MAG: hypothetical protein H3C43_07570 [Leptonema sp. (in: Bacteria)]|nr:hypothetical protein [Leptonema sp. (in: bacteria)]